MYDKPVTKFLIVPEMIRAYEKVACGQNRHLRRGMTPRLARTVVDREALEKNAWLLTSFGMSFNQARVYLAASGLGTPGIEKISQVSGVRREDVYRILPALAEMGVIEKLLTKPVTIRTLPPKKAISILRQNREEIAARELQDLNQSAEIFFKNWVITPQPPEPSPGDDQFSIISGRNSIADRGGQIIGKAESEIWIMSSVKFPFLSIEGNGSLIDAVERGVTVHVTSGPGTESWFSDLAGKKNPAGLIDVRYLETVHSDYMVADKKEALLRTSDSSRREPSSLWTKNRNLISIILGNYDNPGPYLSQK
jgi:sugar-specific transcriptional regulator TrmB